MKKKHIAWISLIVSLSFLFLPSIIEVGIISTIKFVGAWAVLISIGWFIGINLDNDEPIMKRKKQ